MDPLGFLVTRNHLYARYNVSVVQFICMSESLALPVFLGGNLEHCCFDAEYTANLVLLTISLAPSHKSMVARQAAVQTPEAKPVLRAKQLLGVGLCPRPIRSVHTTSKADIKICGTKERGQRLIESSKTSMRSHRTTVIVRRGSDTTLSDTALVF